MKKGETSTGQSNMGKFHVMDKSHEFATGGGSFKANVPEGGTATTSPMNPSPVGNSAQVYGEDGMDSLNKKYAYGAQADVEFSTTTSQSKPK